MSVTRSLDDLRSALRAWNDEASAKVSADPNAYIVPSAGERWMFGSDGDYRRLVRQEFVWGSIENDLEQLPSYTALREAAIASTVVGPMMDQNVGTAMGLSSFSFHRFAMAILPRADEFINGLSSSFESRYDRLTELLGAADAEYRVMYFLQGISFDQDRIILGPDLVIERLTRRETEQALNDSILRPIFGSVPVYQSSEGASFALKKTWRLPKMIGGGISQEQRDEIWELVSPNEIAEEFLQCAALLSGSRVYVAGTMTRRVDDDFSGFATARGFRSLPVPITVGDGLRLDEEQCAELARLWTLAHNESFAQNKALALAVRRLGFAAQRDRAEDRLMDVLIAAEAFYLTDSGDAKDRGELKYRLSLRAAVWAEGSLDDWTRRQVFAHMKRAYDLRSVVAHGSEPKAKDVKLKEVQVGLGDFVNATEEIIRAALRKALNQISGSRRRLSIPWDDLVLPEEGSTERKQRTSVSNL